MSQASTFGSLYLHTCCTGTSSSRPTSSSVDGEAIGNDEDVGDEKEGGGGDDGPDQRKGGNSVLGDVITSIFMGKAE
jgi:hypothetical protein